MRSHLFFLAAALAASGLSACTPSSPYRYSGMIPAARPVPFDGRTAQEGTVRLEGTYTKSEVSQNQAPKLHDTALWVPQATVDGSATIAVTNEVEIGGRFSYGSYDWSRASAKGTMPLPSHPSMWGAGPEVRVSLPLSHDRKVSLGLAGNFLRYRLPIAEWTKTDRCASGATCVTDESTTELGGTTYTLTNQSLQWSWVYSLGVYPSYSFGEHGEGGHLFGVLGLTQAFKNDGFTNTTQTKGAIEGAGPLTVVGLGYGIALHPIRLSAMGYKPMTDTGSPVRYSFGGMFSLGFDLDLWEGRH